MEFATNLTQPNWSNYGIPITAANTPAIASDTIQVSELTVSLTWAGPIREAAGSGGSGGGKDLTAESPVSG